MKTIQKFKIVKKCFPKSWKRKYLLFWPLIILAKCKMDKDEAIGICCVSCGTIVLLCVNNEYRGMGTATALIEESGAKKAFIHFEDKEIVRFWEQRNFKNKEKNPRKFLGLVMVSKEANRK